MKMLKIVSKKFIKFKNLETKKSTSINVLGHKLILPATAVKEPITGRLMRTMLGM